jgi:V/A-type H+-transporting ATPase subunit D
MRLTKSELKQQRDSLRRYERYLPTLQLKKHQLQKEVERARAELRQAEGALAAIVEELEPWLPLLGEEIGLEELLRLTRVEARVDNVAGVDVPLFVDARVRRLPYDLFVFPLWTDGALERLERLVRLRAEVRLHGLRTKRLARELRLTAQRVNLFEKVKIPEARRNIHAISVHLADQHTAAFGWALMAKRKLAS